MSALQTTLRVNDVNVRVHRAGNGDPVLFLHGAAGVSAWLPFFDAVSKDAALIVPEHPGFDGSDDPEWIVNVPDLATFYLDFLEQQNLTNVNVIGTSLGGWIAAEMLIRDRTRVKSVTLLAPAGIRVLGMPCGDNFIWGPEEGVRNLFHDQSFADRLLANPLTEEQLDVRLKNLRTVSKLGWQPRWYNPDLEKWLHRIKVPALVVWGDADKVFPSAYSAAWMKRLPDARLRIIPDCGHLPHIEKSELVYSIISEFRSGLGR